jgi:hypothetical protein
MCVPDARSSVRPWGSRRGCGPSSGVSPKQTGSMCRNIGSTSKRRPCGSAPGIGMAPLVGNSLGGLFSLWFALDQPSRVASSRSRRSTRGRDRRLARRPHHGHDHRAGRRAGCNMDGAPAHAPARRPDVAAGGGRRARGAVGLRRHRRRAPPRAAVAGPGGIVPISTTAAPRRPHASPREHPHRSGVGQLHGAALVRLDRRRPVPQSCRRQAQRRQDPHRPVS